MNIDLLQGQPVVTIRSGESSARILPSHGARLLDWSVAGWDVIRWPANADWDRVPKVRGGDLILFPFIARTYANGQIGSWIDAAGVQRPAPMHGFAKDSPFRILEAADDSLTLRLDSNETTTACYPFAFRLEVTYRIASESLLTSFRVSNRGDCPMPWSAGHHYYFHIPAVERPAWILSMPCEKWGRQNFSDGSISFDRATRLAAPLSDPSWIDRFHMSPALADVEISNADNGKTIFFETPLNCPADWPVVTTWTEKPDSDFFCVEPWSGLPNAIHNGVGLRTLAPGASDEISCRVCISQKAQTN